MAELQFNGLLSQLGLPAVSQEELENQRISQNLQQRLANIDTRGVAPIERGFNRTGQAIGAAIGAGIAGGGVSEEEAKQIEAVQAANENFKKFRAENPELASSPEKAQLSYMRMLSAELLKSGDIQRGTQLLGAVDQKQKMADKQNKELRRLGIDTDIKDEQLGLLRRGELTTVYPKGSTDPNAGFTAFIDPQTGAAVSPEGTALELGKYTTVRPVPVRQAQGSRLTLQQRGINTGYANEIRKQTRAFLTQVDQATRMKNALEDAVAATGDVNILGPQGKITSGFANIVETVQGLARQVGGTVEIIGREKNYSSDLNQINGAGRYARDNFSAMDEVFQDTGTWDVLPENVRKDRLARERFYSAMVQFTYAQARAQEPGARQLSDEDFRRAVAATAASTSDPEVFRQVMLENVNASYEAVNDAFLTLPDNVGMHEIIGKRGAQEFFEAYTNFDNSFGRTVPTFGTAANPGPGLTGTDKTEEQKTQTLINYYLAN